MRRRQDGARKGARARRAAGAGGRRASVTGRSEIPLFSSTMPILDTSTGTIESILRWYSRSRIASCDAGREGRAARGRAAFQTRGASRITPASTQRCRSRLARLRGGGGARSYWPPSARSPPPGTWTPGAWHCPRGTARRRATRSRRG
eukprot:3084430-Prymnesium_polylepis.1